MGRLQRAQEAEDRLLRGGVVAGPQSGLSGPVLRRRGLFVIRQQNFLGLVDPRRKERSAAEVGVQALHQAAMRLADLRRAGAGFKTKDLVGLLLSHGARSWRATLPAAHVRLRVLTPAGKAAVKIGLK